MDFGFWISKRFRIYLKTWKFCPQATGPLVGWTSWRGLKEFHTYHSWSVNIWFFRRMICITRNAA